MTKVDRAKMRKPVGSVPAECKKLIDKLSSAATNEELLVELDEVGTTTWKVPKCELYHWVDVLDKLDEVLSKAAERSTIEVKNEKGETVSKKSYQLALDNDDFLKKLVNSILNFTALLVEYSCSRHIYPSIEHVLNFLLAKDYSIILSVLNLLYVFAKRSNFLTRISSQNRLKLKERLSVLAEDWGGKTNGMALVDCCDPSIKTKNPKCCSVRYQIAEDDNIISIDIPDVSLFGNSPSETMQLLFQKYPATERLAEEKQNHLFARVRLAWAFSEENQYERLCCIQARLHAMSVLVYAQNPATMALSSSCEEMFPSFIEESVQLLKLEDEHLLEIKSAALRTITCIVHLDITTHRLFNIIDATGLSEYHGYLPVLIRKCVLAQSGEQPLLLKQFPQSYSTSLFSLLYHIASNNATGSEALVASGMLDSMLTVIKCFESHADPIMFVTRAVRIIDLITNSVEMKKFRKRGGIEVFIERLALEIDLCKKEQEFELTPRNSEFVSETINPRSTPTFSKTKRQILEITGATNQNPICMPQRAALLKSILNFLKKCIDDNSNSHGENIMVTSLPKSLRHIISNCEYYGSSLYMLSLNLIQSYIQRDPSDLSCVQETGITDVIIQSIVVKDPPISKETVTNLPLTFMNICMNESGMKHFLTYEPFKKFFKIFLRKDYLPALKRNKKSDSHSSSDSTAKAIGRQIDELIRHHPRLKSPVVDAVIDMLNCLVSMSQDDNVTVVKYNQVHSSRDSHAIPSAQDSILDDDESFCRLRPDTPVSSRTSPVIREEPLMEYLVNVLHFIESILSNNNTVDNYREFVTRGGIVDILKLLWMKQKPEDFPRSLGVHQIGKLLNTIFQLSHSDDVTKILFQEMYAFMVRPEYALSKSQQEYKTSFELNEEAPCFLVQCAVLEPEKSKLHQQNFLNELMTLQSMLQIFNNLISVTQRPLLLQEIFKYGFVQLFTEELNNIQRNLHWETLMTYFTFIDETSLKFQHNEDSEKLNKILEQGKSYDRLPAHIQTLFTQAFQTTQTITELKSKVSFIIIGDRHVKSRNDNSRFRDTYRNYRPQVYEKQPEKISDTTSLTGNQLIQSSIDLVRFSSPIEPLQDNSVLNLQLSRLKLLHYSNSLVSLLKTLTDSSATPQFYHFHLVNFYMRDGFTALHVAFKESMDILTENSKSFDQKTCKLEGLMQNLRELNKRAVLNYIELYLNFLSVVTESKSVLKSIYPLPPDVFREFAGASLEGLENEDLFVKSQETIKNKPHSIVPSLLLNVYKLTWNTVQDLIKDDYLMNNDGLSFSVLSLLTNVVKGEELLIEKAMEKRTVPKSDSLSSHRFLSSDFNNDRYMRIFENYIQNGSSQTPTLPMDSELRTELMAMLRDDRSSGLIGSFSSRLFEQLTGNHPSAPRTNSRRVVSSIPGSQASDQVLRETLDRMADKVQNLMEMGFDEATSRTALAMSPNIDSAVDKCLSGGVTDAHITETLTQARRVGLEWGERLMRARGELPQEATANTESIETSTPAAAANNPDNTTTEVEQTETNVEPTDSFESVAEEEEEEPSEMEVVDTLDESVTNDQLTEEATESMVEDASEQTSMEIDEERKKEAEFQRKFNQGDMLNHGKRQEDLKTQYHEYHYEFLKKLHETVSEDSDIKGLSDSYNLWNFVLCELTDSRPILVEKIANMLKQAAVRQDEKWRSSIVQNLISELGCLLKLPETPAIKLQTRFIFLTIFAESPDLSKIVIEVVGQSRFLSTLVDVYEKNSKPPKWLAASLHFIETAQKQNSLQMRKMILETRIGSKTPSWCYMDIRTKEWKEISEKQNSQIQAAFMRGEKNFELKTSTVAGIQQPMIDFTKLTLLSSTEYNNPNPQNTKPIMMFIVAKKPETPNKKTIESITKETSTKVDEKPVETSTPAEEVNSHKLLDDDLKTLLEANENESLISEDEQRTLLNKSFSYFQALTLDPSNESVQKDKVTTELLLRSILRLTRNPKVQVLNIPTLLSLLKLPQALSTTSSHSLVVLIFRHVVESDQALFSMAADIIFSKVQTHGVDSTHTNKNPFTRYLGQSVDSLSKNVSKHEATHILKCLTPIAVKSWQVYQSRLTSGIYYDAFEKTQYGRDEIYVSDKQNGFDYCRHHSRTKLPASLKKQQKKKSVKYSHSNENLVAITTGLIDMIIEDTQFTFNRNHLLRLLTELVLSYPVLGPLILKHRKSFAKFVLENMLFSKSATSRIEQEFENKDANDKKLRIKDFNAPATLFATAMAISPINRVQRNLAKEMLLFLKKSKSLTEGSEKHVRIRAFINLVDMINSLTIPKVSKKQPIPLSKFQTCFAAMLLKRHIIMELSRLPLSLKLDSPCFGTTINLSLGVLKELTWLAKYIELEEMKNEAQRRVEKYFERDDNNGSKVHMEQLISVVEEQRRQENMATDNQVDDDYTEEDEYEEQEEMATGQNEDNAEEDNDEEEEDEEDEEDEEEEDDYDEAYDDEDAYDIGSRDDYYQESNVLPVATSAFIHRRNHNQDQYEYDSIDEEMVYEFEDELENALDDINDAWGNTLGSQMIITAPLTHGSHLEILDTSANSSFIPANAYFSISYLTSAKASSQLCSKRQSEQGFIHPAVATIKVLDTADVDAESELQSSAKPNKKLTLLRSQTDFSQTVVVSRNHQTDRHYDINSQLICDSYQLQLERVDTSNVTAKKTDITANASTQLLYSIPSSLLRWQEASDIIDGAGNLFALGMVLDPVLKEKLKENRDADIETFKKFEKEEKRIKQELIKRVKEQQERERQEIKKKEEEEEKRRAAAAKEEKEKKEKEEAEKKRKEEEEKEKERQAENVVQEETSLPLSQPTTNNSVISETEDDMQTDSNQITAVTDSDIEENTDPPSTQIENNQMDTSETMADQEIPADAQTDQTIPTQTDPFEPNSFASIERSVLFELPTEFATDAVRQTIMQESQRRRQIDNPANIDHTTPLVPESFLHGTNNDPLPEALVTAITNLDTTERANLRRISENQANPAHIIENLDPDSRQEVLRSLPPEYLEQLPPDLINEAQNLMAASSSRRRAIRRNDNSQSRNRMTNNGYAQPIVLKKPTIPKDELLKCKEQLNSIKPKTIIDEDSLVCLMTLFFIPEKTINRTCFNSILKNVLFTTETNVWIVKCLLEILHLTDSQMKSKSTVPLSSVQPAWLNYQVDMSLGQRAPVFSFFQEKTGTFYSRSGNTNEIKLVINPQACSFVDKNVLDSLFSIYKSVTNTFFWPKSETSRCTQNNSNLFKRLVKFDECIGNSEVTKVLTTPKSPNSKNQSFTSPAKQKSETNSLIFKPVNSTADLNNTMFVDLLCMIDNSMIQSNASLMEKFLDAVTVIAEQLSKSKTDEPMDDMTDEKTPLQIAIKHMVSSLVNSNMSDCSVKHLKSVLKNLSRYSKTVSNWIELELLDELRNLGIVLYKNIKVLLQEVENHNAEIGNLVSNQTNKVDTPKSSTPVVQKDTKSGLTTELHLPSMQTLTSRTSVQSLFLRALKILMEVRGKKVTSNAQERRRNRNSRSVDNILEEFSFGGIPTYEEMEQMLSRVQSLNTRFNSRLFQTSSSRWNMDTRRSFSRPDSRSNEVSTNIQVLDSNSQPCQISSSWSHVNNDWMLSSGSQSTAETEITKKSVKSAVPSKFSLADELSSLQCLWETLSQCLDAFDNSGDNNAYLVIQNTVEAFFMVHSLETSKEDKKKSNQMTASTTSEMFVDPELPKETRAFLKFADKHRTVLNQILRQSDVKLHDGPFAILCDHTEVLEFDMKRKYFRHKLETGRTGHRYINDINLTVHRNKIFEDSFINLYRKEPADWKHRITVKFHGEQGQDVGGLLREWYLLLSREMLNPNYGLFRKSPAGGTYQINPYSQFCNNSHLFYFKFIGNIIAKAIFDDKLLDCYFTRAMYKSILGKTLKPSDLQSEDPDLYKNLKFLMENDVSFLGYEQNFAFEDNSMGLGKVIELKENGVNIIVNENNKREYMELLCNKKMSYDIEKQMANFLKGFYEIIPKELISMFDENELELLISGISKIDVEDLKRNTEYKQCTKNTLQVQWFWRAMKSFSQTELAKFMQYVTGTSKIPLQGYAQLEGMNGIQKFTIVLKRSSQNLLPTSHTCFNQLDLPQYETYEKLRKMLLIAITVGSEGFGIA